MNIAVGLLVFIIPLITGEFRENNCKIRRKRGLCKDEERRLCEFCNGEGQSLCKFCEENIQVKQDIRPENIRLYICCVYKLIEQARDLRSGIANIINLRSCKDRAKGK